jgi:hypothetical protein
VILTTLADRRWSATGGRDCLKVMHPVPGCCTLSEQVTRRPTKGIGYLGGRLAMAENKMAISCGIRASRSRTLHGCIIHFREQDDGVGGRGSPVMGSACLMVGNENH